MKLAFDFRHVKATEFGVGRDDGDGQTFSLIPVDGGVQGALREMAADTWAAMQELTTTPPEYEPSEKHGSREHVHLPLSDELAKQMRQLHQANNLPVDVAALSDPAKVFCYFARMSDKKSQRITALRRATQFKGVLKSRLVRLVSDALKIIEDSVFKLDVDFDLLIDNTNVQILRPSGFEFVGKLQEAVLAAVPENVKVIQRDLTFVDFSGIQEYAAKHPRAARYLASIRVQNQARSIDRSALKKLCKDTSVDVQVSRGKITVAEGHVMGFLEVLDRRRYELELVTGSPERFKASSRRRLES